ncbi:MAG: hypothetical protein J5589_11620 [Firmicutes bacterium]|nr:hypothetical protein [Bacillota bacterium]
MADYFDKNKTARDNIEYMQQIIKSPDFLDDQKYPPQERKKVYASIYAVRNASNVLPNKPKTLNVPVPENLFNSYLQQTMNAPSFDRFIQQQGTRMTQIMTNGHGGLAEREYRNYIVGQPKLSVDAPPRYMPSARERIENVKGKLLSQQPTSEEAIVSYAEIFRARRSVGAVHGKNVKTTLPLVIGGYFAPAYNNHPDLSTSNTFRGFVNEKGRELHASMTARHTHGGEAENMYKDYVKGLDHIAEDVPNFYMPQAGERIEALKEKVKGANFSALEPDQQNAIYTEIFATRLAVDAVRGNGKSLQVGLDSAKFKAAHENLMDNPAFQSFLASADRNKLRQVCGTNRGHAGELEDMFKEHILKMDSIPEKTPEKFMPNANKRIEALQDKIKSPAYQMLEPEERTNLFIELMATRNAVNVERGKGKTLEVQVDPKKLKEEREALEKDTTFMEFVRTNPDIVKNAATKGHGGAIEDAYKDHIKNMDHIPETTNEKFMPTAYDHIEAINKKIKSNDYEMMSDEKKTELFAEIIATRTAVGAERKKPDTLKKTFNAKEMNKTYSNLTKLPAFKNFVRLNSALAKSDALSGHGGAVEDRFKEYVKNLDHIPEGIPDKYMPTALERTEILKAKIANCNDPTRVKVMTQELIATRMAVNSTMGNKDSLKGQIQPDKLKEAYDNLEKNETFKSYQEAKGMQGLKAVTDKWLDHGGNLEKDYMKHVVDKTVEADGIIPKGIDNRHKPLPNDLNDRLKKELGDAAKMTDQNLEAQKDHVTRKIATAMCMKRINIENSTETGKKNQMDHAELEKSVNKLMRSNKFKNMINTMGLKNAAQKASKGVTKIFADFNKAPDRAPLGQEPELVAQNQVQLNLENQNPQVNNQNVQPQPVNNQNVQPQPVNNQNVQPNNQRLNYNLAAENPQVNQRRNSLQPRQIVNNRQPQPQAPGLGGPHP